jgi:transcription termination/antitermination protein NusA
MNKDLIAIFEYMEREKGIKRDIVVKAIEESLCIAAKKSIQGSANVSVTIDSRTGDIEVLSEKEIVETVTHPTTQISFEEAREMDPDCEEGEFLDVVVKPKDFGRIAAQKARQIIMQKLRGAERNVIHEEYRHRVNELISGTVKRRVRGANLLVDLGKVEALLPASHYPKTERYHTGERVLALLLEVCDAENGGAEVILSRTDHEFVRQLFMQEVPEINDGTVIIEKIVRDPGYRTKIVVSAQDRKIDPVGACVGMRGARIKNVIRELNNEKIDVIPYDEDPFVLLSNALDPLEIKNLRVNEEDKVVSIAVEDEEFGAALGKRGMNASLNGQLIGYGLEVQKMAEYRKMMEVKRMEFAESDDEALDEPLKIEDVTSLIVDNFIDAGYDTPRKILAAPLEDLLNIPGISVELVDRIFELIM